MYFSNEKTAKKLNIPKKQSKDFFLNDFNKKLDYITNNLPIKLDKIQIDKNNNNEIIQKKDKLTLNPINERFNQNNNYITKDNIEIPYPENEIGIKRLEIYKLYDDDSLSHFFSFISPINTSNINNSMKLKNVEYTEDFTDNNLEKESIFYLINNCSEKENDKERLLNLAEIKNIQSNEIYLNFGEQPLDVYFQITNSKNREKKQNLQLFANYLSSLNKFYIQDPNITLKENQLIFLNKKNEINLPNNNVIKNDLSPKNINLTDFPPKIEEKSKNSNNLIVPILNDINIKNISSKKNEALKEPLLFEKFDFSNKNKYLNSFSANNKIKNDLINKYSVNSNKKEKINELLKEHKYEFKHKKILFNRGKVFKKE